MLPGSPRIPPAGITDSERTWLDAYIKMLYTRLGPDLESVGIFGSKARGDAGPDSDLDLLVIIRGGDRLVRQEVRRIGYRLATATEVVPAIKVYTRSEWDALRRHRSVFAEAVERECVKVA